MAMVLSEAKQTRSIVWKFILKQSEHVYIKDFIYQSEAKLVNIKLGIYQSEANMFDNKNLFKANMLILNNLNIKVKGTC
jgi:hypothetical protein